MHRVLIVGSCVLFTLSACGGGGSPSGDAAATGGGASLPAEVLVSGGVAATVTTINGITVPPDPGTAGKATAAGVDVNANGVRDEVDRELAKLYGSDATTLAAATKYAKEMQAAMVALTSTTAPNINDAVKAEFASLACLADVVSMTKALKISREVRMRTLNSSARREGANRLDDATVGMDFSTFEATPCK